VSTCAVALRRERGAAAEVAGVVGCVVEPGESLYGAACRAVREAVDAALEPWAVDLSGDCAWFAVDVPDAVAVPTEGVVSTGSTSRGAGSTPRAGSTPHAGSTDRGLELSARVPVVTIAFRPLTRADFADVVRWQGQPYVARWWQDEATDVAAAEAHYGPALDGSDPTRMWVLEANGRSVGLLQDYAIGDHPEWALLTARPEAIGVDYLIGDPTWVGRGIGTRMLWTFLRDVVRPHYPRARGYFAAPDHRNAASLRVLDKLGFSRGLWFDEPQPGGRVDTVVGCSLDVARVLGPVTSAK
jgi:aminoglycoside 6'-N-acetyltransferase